MLFTNPMNRSSTYALALSGILILTLAAESMFLAPHIRASALDSMPGWLVNAAGAALYVLGMLLIACTLLNYSRTLQTWIFVFGACGLAALGFALFQQGLIAESILVSAIALAFLLSNWILLKRDWLVEATRWTNLLVGIGLLLRPTVFASAAEYRFLQPEIVRYSFAGLMLVSTALNFWLPRWQSRRFPEVEGLSRYIPGNLEAKIVAVPWILWGLMLIMPLYPINVIIAFSVSASLMLKDLIPWGKMVLQHNVVIGRRFLHLIFAFQSLSLLLAIWVMQLAWNDPALPVATVMRVREITLAGYVVLTLVAIAVAGSGNLSFNKSFTDPTDKQSPGQEYEMQ